MTAMASRLLAALLVATVLLGACGDDDTADDPADAAATDGRPDSADSTTDSTNDDGDGTGSDDDDGDSNGGDGSGDLTDSDSTVTTESGGDGDGGDGAGAGDGDGAGDDGTTSGGGDGEVPDESSTVTPATVTPVPEGIVVGECVNDPGTDPTEVPCGGPHDAEVYHSFELTGSSFPGDGDVDNLGGAGCIGSAFDDFVGVNYDDSDLFVDIFAPDAAAWADGDRAVLCYLYDGTTGDTITGSAAGSGR